MKYWYKLKLEDIYKKLDTSENGLEEKAINERIEKYGYNEIPHKREKNALEIFIGEFIDPIILILLVAIVLSFMTGEIVDGVAIIFIILVDAIIGTIEEKKAQSSLKALEGMIKHNIKVIRNNKSFQIESKYLVVGDIVVLESGNNVPADIRIIESTNLTVDESSLTGESMAASKNANLIDKDVILAERTNMLFAGTCITTGRVTGVVVNIGANTEIGQIAAKVNEAEETPSPLTIRMNKFSKQITVAIIIVGILVAAILFLNGQETKAIILSVIALSVSAMPEGLPLAQTMALTIGSNRMAKKNVIVKKLNSVESLGSCTVIATDKTGTLTANEQTAKIILLPSENEYNISGTGYNNEGEITGDSKYLENVKIISKLGVINNEATLTRKGKNWNSTGDSIDVAFLALGEKAKMSLNNINKTTIIPYESEKKYSAVYYEENEHLYCTAKGSVEKILELSNKMLVGDKEVTIDKDLIYHQNEELANRGYRVIALAYTKKNKSIKQTEDNINNLIFIGLVGFIDPIRKEVKASIQDCKKAGIKVVMITGDHPLTAFAIGKELELTDNRDEVITGDELEKIYKKSKKEFANIANTKIIFSRVTPIQKLLIVEALKNNKEFVAVTGDGVNDAPALKTANIGIAMGSGTDVAKETASMIVIDDNFSSIVEGIKEGRNAYANIRKIIYFLISCGFAEVLFFLLSTILKMDMPLIAIQLLWLNVVTDGLQDLALSFENDTNNTLKEKPRKTDENVFNKKLITEIIISGLSISLIVIGLWYVLINILHYDIIVSRTYIMTLMVFIQNLHVLNCKSENNSIFNKKIFNNPFLLFSITSSILLQLLVINIPVVASIFGVTTLPLINILQTLLLSLPIILIMEVYKYIKKKVA